MLKRQLEDIIKFSPPYLSTLKPSEWAEAHRVMTTDVSAFPGKFSYDRTPYWKEPVNCLSPDHPARRITIMKGAQIGASTNVIENGIGYIMSQQPGTILLAARDEGLVKTMMETKVDQMIDSCNLRDMIRPSIIRKRNARTGDTSLSKEFAGGWLKAFSIQTPAKMRQISCKYGFLDDFEAAPNSKDAGSASALFETRFKSFTNNGMKLFYISTPEIAQTSNIEPLYLEGDQRRYTIPCPCCGVFIALEWNLKTDDGKAGITYKLDNHGRVIKGSTGYVCQSCAGFFNDRNKYQMLLDGEWTPTAQPVEEGNYSYQISSLYAPLGMAGWEDYAIEYVKACPIGGAIDKALYHTFTNTVLGHTWVEMGEKPEAKGIALNTRGYEIGIIPDVLSIEDGNGKIIMVTCAADLGGTDEDARIDYEIVAWSEMGTPYSIDHGSVGTFINRDKGKTDRKKYSYDLNSSNSVWVGFQEILDKDYKTESGSTVKIVFSGLDTGHFTRKAYDFLTVTKSNVFGLKGDGKFRREGADTKTFKLAKERNNLYLLDVNQIKDELASAMKLKWGEDTEQPVGFLNYPTPSDGKYTYSGYFQHYEAEHKIVKKSRIAGTSSYIWEKRNSTVQNHLWDCRVYNIAVKDIVTFLICKERGELTSWANCCNLLLG